MPHLERIFYSLEELNGTESECRPAAPSPEDINRPTVLSPLGSTGVPPPNEGALSERDRLIQRVAELKQQLEQANRALTHLDSLPPDTPPQQQQHEHLTSVGAAEEAEVYQDELPPSSFFRIPGRVPDEQVNGEEWVLWARAHPFTAQLMEARWLADKNRQPSHRRVGRR